MDLKRAVIATCVFAIGCASARPVHREIPKAAPILRVTVIEQVPAPDPGTFRIATDELRLLAPR
jgi:hypothetical protein